MTGFTTASVKYSLIETVLLLTLVVPGSPATALNLFPTIAGDSVEYSAMIRCDSMTQEEIKKNSRKLFDFINPTPPAFNRDDFYNPVNGNFRKAVGFNLYEKNLVTRNPAGYAVGLCNLQILGDSCIIKIKRWKYTEIKKNRYAQFKPSVSGYESLERVVKIHNSKEWKARMNDLNDKINQFLNTAENIMKGKQP